MELEDLLKKIDDLNKKEEVAKQREKDEYAFNVKKDYEIATSVLEKKLRENPDIKNVLRLYEKVRREPFYLAKKTTEYEKKLFWDFSTNTSCNAQKGKICFLQNLKYCPRLLLAEYTDRPYWYGGARDVKGIYLSIELKQNDDLHYWYKLYDLKEKWTDLDKSNLSDIELMTKITNEMIDKLDDFTQGAKEAIIGYVNEKENVYGNVELDETPDFEKNRVSDEMNKYYMYCKTYDGHEYYMPDDDTLLCVNSSLSDAEKLLLMKNAMEQHIDNDSNSVYVFATSTENRDRLEDLWKHFIDEEEEFEFVSDEFENGLENYKDEIGLEV